MLSRNKIHGIACAGGGADDIPERLSQILFHKIIQNTGGKYAAVCASLQNQADFHKTLCGNPQIMKLYESNWSIGTMFYMYSATNLPLDQLKTSFHQHKEILNTLKAKDEAALQKIIEEHMSIVYETLEWYSQAAKH